MIRRRGAALILALGILALLTMLVVSFALLTQVETSAATNYREGERARTIAKSGIERAQAELRRAVTTPGYPLPWLVYDAFDYKAMHRNTATELLALTKPSLLDVGITKVGTNPGIDATRAPSLGMWYDPGTTPKALTDNANPWPSGVVGSTYYTDPVNPMFRGDYYTLRITDTSAQLYLNDDNPNLARMIDHLSYAWGKISNDPAGAAMDGIGAKVMAVRPADGFRRMEEVTSIATLSDTERKRLASLVPYMTTVARVDQKVVEMGSQPAQGAIAAHPAFLSIQPRAAVNINLAPAWVLAACMSEISGGGVTITRDQAIQIAQKIVTYRWNPGLTDQGATAGANLAGNPATQRWGFQHWGEFKQFLMDGSGQGCGLDERTAAVVLSNANPNTDLNKFVPDNVIDTPVDKNDLTKGGTEFCFGSGGVYQIESLGVVLGPLGNAVATAKARAVVRAFERYVETTQADFESGRVDPPGKIDVSTGVNLQGLRDIASLPESRNAIDALILGDLAKDEKTPGGNAGMHAADYDGQLTFNVISHTKVAQPWGVYVGFIDRTLDGTRADGSGPGTIIHEPGGARVDRARPTGPDLNQVLGLVLDEGNPTNPNQAKRRVAPNFNQGSDYHPLAAHLGRPEAASGSLSTVSGSAAGRELCFAQDEVVKPEEIDFGDTEVSIPVHQDVQNTLGALLGTVDFTVHEKVTSWTYNPIYKQGFEFWFKPARRADNPSKIVLFDWQSNGIQRPGQTQVTVQDTLTDYQAVAGPANGSGGTFFVPATYNNAVASADPKSNHQDVVTWGAGARVTIWLQNDMGANQYSLHVRFKMQPGSGLSAAEENSSRYQGAYDKEWVGPTAIHTGTWHHVLMSWESPTKKADCPGEHSFVYVDGNKVQGLTEPDWPTEISPRGQLVIAAVLNLIDYITEILAIERAAAPAIAQRAFINNAIPPDPEVYRGPVQVAPGNVVWVGACDLVPEPDAPDFGLTSAARYLGLMDNVIFQDKWRKDIPSSDLNGEAFLPRYDTCRPSEGDAPGLPTASGFKPLVFTKHTQALDWGRPIRVIAYDVTAWKTVGTGDVLRDVDSGSSMSSDAGKVFFHFGFTDQLPQPTGNTLVSQVPALYPPTWVDPNTQDAPNTGWTPRLNGTTGTPFNCVASGYLIPAREAGGHGGFLTRGLNTAGPNEYTLYAIEMYPFAEAQTGPRMAPVVDDVNVVYMRWDTGTIIEEEEVVDTE